MSKSAVTPNNKDLDGQEKYFQIIKSVYCLDTDVSENND